MGFMSAWRLGLPKFLHFGHSIIAVMIDLSSRGLWILSMSVILMASRCQCPPFSCSRRANALASLRVTHSCFEIPRTAVLLPILHNFPSVTKYSCALCFACCFSLVVEVPSISKRASSIWRNSGSLINLLRRFCLSVSGTSNRTSWIRPWRFSLPALLGSYMQFR